MMPVVCVLRGSSRWLYRSRNGRNSLARCQVRQLLSRIVYSHGSCVTWCAPGEDEFTLLLLSARAFRQEWFPDSWRHWGSITIEYNGTEKDPDTAVPTGQHLTIQLVCPS